MSDDAPRRVSVAAADHLIRARLMDCPVVEVPLEQARGEILAEDLGAERDQPPFDRATMDGIAIRYSDIGAGHRRFRISHIQAAGDPPTAVDRAEHCAEIMTGAVLPPGTDTVIPVERVIRENEQLRVEDNYHPEPAQFVHHQGSDHRAGTLLLTRGVSIRSPEMAVLLATGRSQVKIAQRPAIAVISTGTELVEAGQPIEPHQVRSSNDHAIQAALLGRGFTKVSRKLVADDPKLLKRTVKRLHKSHDLLILSGGVSMGKYDYVPEIMKSLGVELVFHKVRQRPGLPMWFGMSAEGKPVFALPGNPVSSLVCLIRYVIPGLEHALGASSLPREQAALDRDVEFRPDLTWFLPVHLSARDGNMLAEPKPTNTSGDFIALKDSDGFVELPEDRKQFPAGFVAELYRWP